MTRITWALGIAVCGFALVVGCSRQDDGQPAETDAEVETSQTETGQPEAEVAEMAPPPGAVTPFDAVTAEKHQQAWADYIKAPVEITNSIGMKLKLIPAGEFIMGSPGVEKDHGGNEEQHRVRITRPFYMGMYEVTQEQYKQVMDKTPSHFKDLTRPVERVGWNDAVEFCRRLSEKEDREYRLPTEAQWEYACRAGTTTQFTHGDALSSKMDANFSGEHAYVASEKGPGLGRTATVGSYRANAWGLYDMHGNVWERCQDWYAADYYTSSPVDDPPGPAVGSNHVARGGCWGNNLRDCRSAKRREVSLDDRSHGLGFRIVQVSAE